ncbi:MAG: cyclase family protein [Rhodospirillales bacterium]
MIDEFLELVRGARAYDLAQPWFVGMPHYPSHPPFLFSLSKKHGDYVAPGGVSSASEAIALGGHVGTHMDALCHYSCGGMLHGGVAADGVQSYSEGLRHLSIDIVGLVLRRGVLLDIAGLEGVEALPVDYTITPECLDAAVRAQNVEIRRGDVVLLRTGWGRFWNEPARYIAEVRGPGPEAAGARWLSERGIYAAGSDTVSFERVPAPSMPVHVHLLVESGIHIIESLNLEEVARERVHTFLFVAAPLKIRGGTGSPLRPFAVAPA